MKPLMPQLVTQQQRRLIVHRSKRLSMVLDTSGGGEPIAGGEIPQTTFFRVGALSVSNLGQVTEAVGFHTKQFIFPIGYKAIRCHWSTTVPNRRAMYHCEINKVNNKPHFLIFCSDDSSIVSCDGSSATDAWLQLQTAVSKCNGLQLVSDVDHTIHASLFFGVCVPTIAKMIEGLPGAEGCMGYCFQHADNLPAVETDTLPLPTNPSGCARTEIVALKTVAFKWKYRCHFREFHNRGAERGLVEKEQNLERNQGRARKRVGERVGEMERGLPLSTQYRLLRQNKRNLVVMRSEIHNWGLFTLEAAVKDAMLLEYMGQMVRLAVGDRREKTYSLDGTGKVQGGDCYMFRLDEEYIVDATQKGNIARFMNHSCDPNAYTRIVTLDGPGGTSEKHIVIIAKRDLVAGEEITYDYQFAIEKEKQKIPCHCGSTKCPGFLN